MGHFNRRVLNNWLVPLLVTTLFLTLLVEVLPYATGYGWLKISLGRLIWTVCRSVPDYEYCLVVPFICLILLYLRLDAIARTPIAGSNAAFALLVLGLLIYWLGLRAEMQYFGFLAVQLLLAGLVMWFWGVAMFRALLFPWAFLAFAWPLPFLEPLISVQLRLFMTHLAYDCLTFLHIACLQNGTGLLSLPDAAAGLRLGDRFRIDITDPCSGMRSLFALMMISALYANLMLARGWQQWLVFLAAVPTAILGNLARVLLLTFASLLFGSDFALGANDSPSWFHEASGFAVFFVALALEFALGTFLTRLQPPPATKPA